MTANLNGSAAPEQSKLDLLALVCFHFWSARQAERLESTHVECILRCLLSLKRARKCHVRHACLPATFDAMVGLQISQNLGCS